MEVLLKEKRAFRNLAKMVILKTIFIGCYVHELGFEFLPGKKSSDLMNFQHGLNKSNSQKEIESVENELRKILKFVG